MCWPLPLPGSCGIQFEDLAYKQRKNFHWLQMAGGISGYSGNDPFLFRHFVWSFVIPKMWMMWMRWVFLQVFHSRKMWWTKTTSKYFCPKNSDSFGVLYRSRFLWIALNQGPACLRVISLGSRFGHFGCGSWNRGMVWWKGWKRWKLYERWTVDGTSSTGVINFSGNGKRLDLFQQGHRFHFERDPFSYSLTLCLILSCFCCNTVRYHQPVPCNGHK